MELKSVSERGKGNLTMKKSEKKYEKGTTAIIYKIPIIGEIKDGKITYFKIAKRKYGSK
jgi:hypothetical protein